MDVEEVTRDPKHNRHLFTNIYNKVLFAPFFYKAYFLPFFNCTRIERLEKIIKNGNYCKLKIYFFKKTVFVISKLRPKHE